jgi:hypothetical protein
MDELIDNVVNEYHKYEPGLLQKVFLTLQGCMMDGGGNRNRIPHIGKDSLEALSMLPNRLCCDCQLYERAVEALGN